MAEAPPAEVVIDEALVRRLLAEQHPDLAARPLSLFAHGWDNIMYRLGEDLAVRLPRRVMSAFLVLAEQRWLPELAPHLPLPIPAPLRTGTPGAAYPWPWSVTPWLPGGPADRDEPAADQGVVLAEFLRSLHAVSPPDDGPTNAYRGGLLADRAPFTDERIARVRAGTALITPAIERLWAAALESPIDAPRAWIHGDLHARNVLTEEGRFTAIIDWGDVSCGDPATDLAAVWMLLGERRARDAALEAYGGISPATLARARGWAVVLGVMLADVGLGGDSRMGLMGERTLYRLADGP